MPSPVQSNCDAHDTIANGQSAFLRQQETDLPPAELCSVFADRTIYLSSAASYFLTRPLPCRLLHIPVVLNDFHSRETTLTLIGHDFLQKHLHQIGVKRNPDCPLYPGGEAMNFVSLTVCASLANTGFTFSSDNFTAKASLHRAALREMAYMVYY
ncbi:uncharacterized protein TNCV_5073231 [Trichonephila clavipes]|nr:uncharacterized protein TNCV_5073231 [Trichonephila clavipes]